MKPFRERLPLLLLLILVPEVAAAQVRQAELAGTVIDQSNAVLPGVTVSATHVSTNQTRSTITDSGGTYLFTALPVGEYEIRAQLVGLTTVLIQRVQLGIGEHKRIDIQMKVATVEEVVTVSGETPFIDPARSDLSGRVDQRQVELLPISGRNWLSLGALAPGVKSEAGGGQPTAGVGDFRMSKVFLDGGSVMNRASSGVDLDVSKEIIGEFEVITSRFDAAMGHAGTVVTNAVTKSGTDQVHGSGFFYWRDDSLNARDFFTHKVEPYQNRQFGATFGAPIIKSRTHAFLSYERQQEPKTLSANTGFALLDAPVDSTETVNMYFARIDHSFTARHRLNVRGNRHDREQPNSGVGGPRPLSNGRNVEREVHRVAAGLNSVFGNRFVNQVFVTVMDTAGLTARVTEGPAHIFPAVSLGASGTGAGNEHTYFYSVRNDASYLFEKGGRHSLKFGFEFDHSNLRGANTGSANGSFFYNQNAPNIGTCCVDIDQSKWDKSRFPVPVRFQQAIGDLSLNNPDDVYSLYVQDDWGVHPRLTLNLGVRYDLEIGSLAHDETGLAVAPHENDTNNIQPRIGFAWDIKGDGRIVVRGGSGLYVDQVFLNAAAAQRRTNSGKQLTVTTFNTTNNPNFANDPLGGLTFEDFARASGALNVTRLAEDMEQPEVWSWSIGIGRQLPYGLAVTADYVGQRTNSMLRAVDTNLFCCLDDGNAIPIRTGNYPELGGVVTGAGRPDPRFNSIQEINSIGVSRYHGLQVAATKRMARALQFGAMYVLSWTRDDQNGPVSFPNNMFDLADEYGPSLQDQRHHFVGNWVSRLPYGFEFSGIVSLGSGRIATSAAGGGGVASPSGGLDLNGDGTPQSDRPTCGRDPTFIAACGTLEIPNGQRVPRNPIYSSQFAKVDLRLAWRARFRGVTLDPSVEVFNLFNRMNLDPARYNMNLASPAFGEPGRSDALPYLPRQIQLGVRMTF